MRCDIDVHDGELSYRGDMPGEHPADLAMTASPTEFELVRLAPAAARSTTGLVAAAWR